MWSRKTYEGMFRWYTGAELLTYAEEMLDAADEMEARAKEIDAKFGNETATSLVTTARTRAVRMRAFFDAKARYKLSFQDAEFLGLLRPDLTWRESISHMLDAIERGQKKFTMTAPGPLEMQ